MLSTKESDTSAGPEILNFEPPRITVPQDAPQAISSNKRFLTALSFPGESRKLVAQVASHLEIVIGRERTLYDKFFEAEFARPNLDTYLQNLYHNESELVVVFLGSDYERKDWPGLEWRAVRDLLKKRKDASVMIVRLDDGDVKGSFSIDGYINAAGRCPDEIAGLILDRLHILTFGRGPHQAASAPRPPRRFADIASWVRKNSRQIILVVCLMLALLAVAILTLRPHHHQTVAPSPSPSPNIPAPGESNALPPKPPDPLPSGGDTAPTTETATAQLALSGGPMPAGIIGRPYHFIQRPVALDRGIPLRWTTRGTGVPGLHLDPRTGSLAGVPRVAGNYRISIRVTDGKEHSAGAEFWLTIGKPLGLTVDTPPPEGTAGVPYAYNLRISGGTEPYGFRLDRDGVPGLQLDRDTGKLSGVPTAPGRFAITVRATDSADSTLSAPLSITILPPVVIDPVGVMSDVVVGHSIPDLRLRASGGTGHYNWSSAATLPPGLRLGQDGVLSGVPAEAGNYSLAVHLEDAGGGTANVSLHLAVRAAPLRLAATTFRARLGQPFSEEIVVVGTSEATVAVPKPPPFLTFDAVSHRLKGMPGVIGSFDFLVRAGIGEAGTVLPVRVDVPLRIFVEKPFGLEPELSLFQLMADSCLSHQPYIIVASRDEADAVLTCLQCSAANGRIPIQLNAAFDLPARGRSSLPRRSLWTYSFIKSGLTENMKSTEACTGELGLQNSLESINRNLQGDK